MKRRSFLMFLFSGGIFFLLTGGAGAQSAAAPSGDLTVVVGGLGKEIWIHPLSGSQEDMNQLGVTNDFLFRSPEKDDRILGPALAEKWETSKDGLVHNIYLRRGVQFHDGWGEFTSADVKFTIELLMSKGSIHSTAGMFMRAIDSVETPEKYHVRIKCKEPFIDLLYQLSNFDPWVPMLCKKYVESVGVEAAGKHPVGTGPWKFVNHSVASFVKYEAVENHWRKTPAFKTLTIRLVPEEAARIAMLRAKQADVATISLTSKKIVVPAGFQVIKTGGKVSQAILLGGQVLPTREKYDPTVPWVDGNDPARALKVRKALTLAINKKKILDHIFAGEGEVIEKIGHNQGSIWSDPSWKPNPYDPEQAKKLLVEAGYPNGFRIDLKLFSLGLGREESPAMGQAVAMDWSNIGIKVNQELTEYARIKPKWAARNSAWEAWTYGITGYAEDWMTDRILFYSKTQTLNQGFESQRLDEFLDKLNTTIDEKERVKIARQMGAYMYNNYSTIGIVQNPVIVAVGPRVSSWPMARNNTRPNNFEYITRAR